MLAALMPSGPPYLFKFFRVSDYGLSGRCVDRRQPRLRLPLRERLQLRWLALPQPHASRGCPDSSAPSAPQRRFSVGRRLDAALPGQPPAWKRSAASRAGSPAPSRHRRALPPSSRGSTSSRRSREAAVTGRTFGRRVGLVRLERARRATAGSDRPSRSSISRRTARGPQTWKP